MELRPMRSQLLPMLSDRTLELILLPTEQCNFRCTYCYEDFAIGRMKRDTINGVKELMRRRAGDLSALQISWFGGEPLLAKPVVYEISEHAQLLAREHARFRYTSGMTTNAYLLDAEACARLTALGVRDFQVSLDGWKETHDASRQRADGKGTFERIWANLVSMQRSNHEFSVMLRVHLQPHSVVGMQEFATELIRVFAQDSRFEVSFYRVGNWGGPKAAQIETLSEEEGEQIKTKLSARWRDARPHSVEVASDGASAKPFVCYAARPNSLMIRANGKVGKCTVMLTDARNEIGALRSDGTIDLHPGRLAPWLRGFKSLDLEELGCPAVNLPAQTQDLLQIAS